MKADSDDAMQSLTQPFCACRVKVMNFKDWFVEMKTPLFRV